jgi:hypothetical protein
MKWLRRVERVFESTLEGTGSHPHELQLAHRLERALVDGVRRLGRARYAPNRFVCGVPEGDYSAERLADHLARIAQDRGYRLAGPLQVAVVRGPVKVQVHFADAAGRAALGLIEGLKGPAEGRYVCVAAEGVVVGRGDQAGFSLVDPGVSRQHLSVQVLEGKVRLEDLGSHNGTRLGKRRLEGAAEVASGTKVEIGESTLRVWVL